MIESSLNLNMRRSSFSLYAGKSRDLLEEEQKRTTIDQILAHLTGSQRSDTGESADSQCSLKYFLKPPFSLKQSQSQVSETSPRRSFEMHPRITIIQKAADFMEMEKERGNSVKSMEFILDWNECLKANDLELMESQLKDEKFRPDRLSYAPKQQQQQQRCICKKTKCQKLYCQCFQQGKACNEECECFNCCNNEGKHVADKPLRNTFPGDSMRKQGCNCRKSKCKKKYCECFNDGMQCNENCNCNHCENQVFNDGLVVVKKTRISN